MTPSRSSRALGSRPRSSSQRSMSVGRTERARLRSRHGGQSTLEGRCGPSTRTRVASQAPERGRQPSGEPDSVAAAGVLPPAATRCCRRPVRGGQPGGGGHGPRRIHRRAALHDPGREVGRLHVAGDLHVPPDPGAARDDRPLADDRDAGVEPGRLLAVRRVEVRSVADDRARPDDDLLVEDRAVDDRPGADHRVEHHDRIADDRADVDPDARRQDAVHDRPVDHAAVADQAPVDLRRRADLGRRPLLGPRVDRSSRGRTGRAPADPRAGRGWPPSSVWIVPTSCQ